MSEPLNSLLLALENLYNGGPFDLTDSPKSFIANVRRMVAETRQAQRHEQNNALAAPSTEYRQTEAEDGNLRTPECITNAATQEPLTRPSNGAPELGEVSARIDLPAVAAPVCKHPRCRDDAGDCSGPCAKADEAAPFKERGPERRKVPWWRELDKYGAYARRSGNERRKAWPTK